MKINFVCIIITLLLVSSVCFAEKSDPTIAVVNGKAIRKSFFEKTYKENLLFVSDKIVTRDSVIKDLINRELGIQRAKKSKLFNDPIVKKKMEDVLYHAQISKDLEPQLKKIVVTNQDVEKYYSSHREYRTAHILFRVQAAPTIEEALAAQKQAIKTYKILQHHPTKFSEMANKFSQSSSAANGGDMGFQPAIRLAPEFFQAISGNKKGFVTSPVRTQFGYHIIKILAIKDYKSINMALYKKVVYDIRRDAIIAKYFENLRKKAKITINNKLLKVSRVSKKSKSKSKK